MELDNYSDHIVRTSNEKVLERMQEELHNENYSGITCAGLVLRLLGYDMYPKDMGTLATLAAGLSRCETVAGRDESGKIHGNPSKSNVCLYYLEGLPIHMVMYLGVHGDRDYAFGKMLEHKSRVHPASVHLKTLFDSSGGLLIEPTVFYHVNPNVL